VNRLPSRRSFTRGASSPARRPPVVTLRDRATPLQTISARPPASHSSACAATYASTSPPSTPSPASAGAFTDQRVEVLLEAGSVLVFNDYAQHGRALLGRPLSRPGSCQTGGYATLLTPTSIHSFALYPDLWF